MNLTLTEEQQLLKDAFVRLFARESSLERVRATGTTGFDPGLWTALAEAGATIARVPEDAGGLGLSLLDAALIAEEAGRALTSAPVVEVMVAARLLAAFRGGAEWVGKVAQGAIVALALDPAQAGIAALVPGGAVAEAVLALDGDDLVLVTGSERATPVANSGLLPVASWTLGGERTVLASGDEARTAFEMAIAEWKILTSAWLAGLAREALNAASAYARERIQFGRPIGSFQGLAHPLAEAVTEVEGSQLLTWKAIAAIAEEDACAAALTSLAWWWAGQSTIKALRQSIRTLGGYGLSLEYDLHLYHRRGTATVLLGGDPEAEAAHAGELLFNQKSTPLPDAGDVGISFARSDATQAHVDRLDAFFQANWDERMEAKGHHSTSSHDRELHRKLAEAGLIFRSWPADQANHAHAASEDFATSLVFEKWNYTSHVLALTNMTGQIVLMFGSDAAKDEVLPRIKSGESVCSLGFSEPASGSDVFAARTSARQDGDDWIINGAKMFTTGAHYADYVLMLTRTSSDGPKHEGLTMFIVPTSLPGYEFQAVHTYQDERTNITYYDMRVPDRYRLGEIGKGAAVMGASLTLEHSGGNYFSGQTRMLRNALSWANEPGPGGTRPIDDPRVRTGLAKVRARYEVAACFVDRSIAASLAGVAPRREWGPMAKLFITESFLQNCWDVLEMGGPDSIRTGDHPLGVVELDHRRAYGTTIYGGTSEVHRSMVAEQALGLPKSRS